MTMNWISKVTFNSKCSSITENEIISFHGFLGETLNQTEIKILEKACKDLDVNFRAWDLPNYRLPNEYIELLKYSNGGNFCNGNREIGYFDLSTIREMYISYLFPEFLPGAVPFGFNGGGTFYAYDFRSFKQNPPIIATAAGCLDWDEVAILGNSLEEVFSKQSDIDDELY